MDFKKERVNCHNKYPELVQFKAERKFKGKLDQANGVTPFEPTQIGYGDDAVYQTCIGHLIDGLEFLPYRPDYMFDHSFKVIAETAGHFFPGKGIKGIVQGLPTKLLNHSISSHNFFRKQIYYYALLCFDSFFSPRPICSRSTLFSPFNMANSSFRFSISVLASSKAFLYILPFPVIIQSNDISSNDNEILYNRDTSIDVLLPDI